MTDRKITRRELLASGAALPLLGGARTAQSRPASPRNPGKTRNIIFMVSDGMSAGVPSLAEPFARMVRGEGTQWRTLADAADTTRGYLETASLSSMVTDSSAASSAWGSGSRVANGAVNVLPDGTRLRPIADVVREAGKAVGLVTTTTVTHATPAGFAAAVPNRGDQATIATQYLDRVDVVLGGGHEFFRAETRPDRRDLIAEYRAKGYTICTSREQLLQTRSERTLGLFWTGHLPYTIDQVNRPDAHARVPSLREMTRAALRKLSGAENGFLLQVEGGRVDHAAHNNDAAALLWDQLAFDDAVAEAISFLAENPDTLIVVTTDHGNANPGLNGIGSGYGESTACFERLAGVKASFPTIHAALGPADPAGAPRTPAEVSAIVGEHTGLDLSEFEAESVARTRAGGTLDELNAQHTGFPGAMGQAFANHVGIAWTGTSHTNEIALTLAVGAGRERFAGVMHHTDVYDVICDLCGAWHTNPRMTGGA